MIRFLDILFFFVVLEKGYLLFLRELSLISILYIFIIEKIIFFLDNRKIIWIYIKKIFLELMYDIKFGSFLYFVLVYIF